ncbi:MAG TPA: DUF2339 domain-containing protein [Pyrinomonadaceae bacterium]|nr:DUF2339 domain-containing protein [Pyrinomonadaceae bacterium]
MASNAEVARARSFTLCHLGGVCQRAVSCGPSSSPATAARDGLALLSLTVLKVFLWDLSSLDRVYRIISFIMLGAILLVVSYFYQRSQQPVDET